MHEQTEIHAYTRLFIFEYNQINYIFQFIHSKRSKWIAESLECARLCHQIGGFGQSI